MAMLCYVRLKVVFTKVLNMCSEIGNEFHFVIKCRKRTKQLDIVNAIEMHIRY